MNASVMHKNWHSILKFTLWSSWIARNNCVFSYQRPIFHIVAIKSLAWFSESIGHPISSFPSSLRMGFSCHIAGKTLNKPVLLPSWRFRGDKDAFISFWISSSSTDIFFDGASKGNPRVSGAGGLVISPDRLSSFSFSWGLGITSNNQAESYILLLAC